MTNSKSKRFGLQVDIDGKEFIQFSSLSVTSKINQFIDTFNITVANPQGRNSRTVPVGGVVSIKNLGVEIFRGVAEQKKATYKEVGSDLTFSGREELFLCAEDDADPSIEPFIDQTDNDIISKMLEGYPWAKDFDEAVKVKKYTIPSGSTRRSQIITEIAKRNDFIVYKRGATIFKKKIASIAEGVSEKFTMQKGVEDSKWGNNNDRVLSVNCDEDISSCRGKVVGFCYQGAKKRPSERNEQENSSLQDGSYANRLRNKTGLKGYPVTNKKYITSTGKDQDELEKNTKRLLRDTDIVASISITTAGLTNIKIMDVIDVQIEPEGILQYMVVHEVTLNYSGNNKLTSTVICKPFEFIQI